MTQIIADASIIGNILLEDEKTERTEVLLDVVMRAELIEPVHWPIESCGLILKASRRQRLSVEHRDNALAIAQSLIALAEIESSSRIKAVIEKALLFHISIYDAAYLELALRTGIPLLVSDKPLRGVAAKAGVELVSLP